MPPPTSWTLAGRHQGVKHYMALFGIIWLDISSVLGLELRRQASVGTGTQDISEARDERQVAGAETSRHRDAEYVGVRVLQGVPLASRRSRAPFAMGPRGSG